MAIKKFLTIFNKNLINKFSYYYASIIKWLYLKNQWR